MDVRFRGPQNARFWVYWRDAPVKLTLRPGQALEAHYGGRTDEGWSSYDERWEYDAEEQVVRCQCISDGVDCDGRMTRHWLGVCPLDRLDRGNEPDEYPDVVYPAWVEQDRYQRDYAAEAAGY